MNAHPSIELARVVVADVAPTELPRFGLLSRAYVQDPRRARGPRGRDDPLGFGLAEVGAFLTPVILGATGEIVHCLAEELAKSLARTTIGTVTDRISKLLRRRPPAPPTIKAAQERIEKLVRRAPDAQPLSQDQVTKIRGLVLQYLRAQHVAEVRASELTAALLSRLDRKPESAT